MIAREEKCVLAGSHHAAHVAMAIEHADGGLAGVAWVEVTDAVTDEELAGRAVEGADVGAVVRLFFRQTAVPVVS